MKRIDVQVRSEDAPTVVRLGNAHGGFAPSHHPVEVEQEAGWSLIMVNLPNAQVGSFVEAVESAVEKAAIVIPTGETIPVRSPVSDVRDRVARVTRRSTYELVLDVLQSIGSWQGMLLYAVVSGLVAAYGLIFGIPFLLTAAMLIAPLGAPAMVCVVGIAIGDAWMIRKGALRFSVALLVVIAAAAALGWAYDLAGASPLMETLTQVSVWSAVIGVAGGAAGALALAQADRDSLVTATATGFLVAVSLSPPAAVLGLALILGRWDYVVLQAFLVGLTAVGILLGGWAGLTLIGIRSSDFSGGRGRRWVRGWTLGSLVLILVGLVAWQFTQDARFRKADAIRLAESVAERVVASGGRYHALRTEARFVPGRGRSPDQDDLVLSVLLTPRVAYRPSSSRSLDSLRSELRSEIASELAGVTPYVRVEVLAGPDTAERP